MYNKENPIEYSDQVLQYISDAIGQDEIPSSIKTDWKLSQEAYQGDKMYFLHDTYIADMNNILRLPDDTVSAILEVMQSVRVNPILGRIIWHYYYLLYIRKINVINEVIQLSQRGRAVQNLFPFPGEMLPVIIVFAGLKQAIELHQSLNIPHKVTVDTFSDIKIWMEDFYKKNGFWGLSELNWLYRHLSGSLYRIGRLQYIHKRFTGKIKVFRRKSSKEIVVFPEAGQIYRKDGLLDGTNNIYDRDSAWVSALEINDQFAVSNCILINGRAQKKNITISLAEWELALSTGDYILEIHIPAGSRLDLKECKESLAGALLFYKNYFPNRSITAFTCGSWLLEPQFEKILPQTSNIVQFQKLFHIYPIPGNEGPFLDRVFGYGYTDKLPDLQKLPRETSLQRAIADFLISGNRMRPAAGIILADEEFK